MNLLKPLIAILLAFSVSIATALPVFAADIVDTAVSAGSFDTLVAAVKAAGLVDTLKGAGPFTVFAPTDEAFADLPDGTVDNLLKPENKEKLSNVLLYHVVKGKVTSGQLKSGSVTTVQGEPLKVSVGKEVQVNDAVVIKADISTDNGVIHVIDKVLIP
ncbi:MAG: fasciclin domain-containing protein [Oscillatoriales cyanobacterium RM2_1_1]|nr:fasciclin domain-containing protein [Oscillatoriales cyanobacterium SM2_3_0]NJO44398.1 fasciclin domain-containing protein [Oscillatoriales cyanobacterium RM2_1_1]